MSRRLLSGDKDLYNAFRNVYGVPSEVIESFNEPVNIARFFHQEIKQGMKEMGFSIDWRREFTTIDEAFSKFISWQFNLLKRKGLIIQGSHPVGWCPRDQNPVSQHDTLGDIEPNFIEYTLIKFKLADTYVLPVATLRPETVYGVTNLWVNPHVRYVAARVDEGNNPMWIISRDAVMKLKHQGHKVDIDHEIDGMKLVGEYASNPITQNKLPIYPASFVDPKDGSGAAIVAVSADNGSVAVSRQRDGEALVGLPDRVIGDQLILFRPHTVAVTGEHPGRADAGIVAFPADDGSVAIGRQRYRPALGGKPNRTAADQLVALLQPHPVDADVDPCSPGGGVVVQPANDGRAAVGR
jgi:leucyl-tRNA synthetase